MKKYLFIILSVITLAGFTACSEDELVGSHNLTNNITIVSQNVCFDAAASQGTIVYTASTSCTVKSSADWCKVTTNGNTINVSVDANEAYEGRNAVVSISDGSETKQVAVSQKGIIINFKFESQTIDVESTGGTYRFSGSATDPIQVTSSADWAHVSMEGDSVIVVTIDKNSAAQIRQADVTVSAPAHDNSAVITFSQMGRTLTPPEGYYSMSFATKSGGTPVSADVTITKSETEDNTYLMDLSAIQEGWVVPMTMDTENKMFVIKNGAYIGMYNYQGTDYYSNVLVYYTNGSSNYISYSTDSLYDIYLSYTIDATTGAYAISLYNSGAAFSRTSLGMQVNLFKTDEPVKANRFGSILTIVNPTLTCK